MRYSDFAFQEMSAKEFERDDKRLAQIAKKQRGGPTEKEPERPYCKDDQSCCDFCCGN